MTCAYAVRVALKKFPGVESVDVSLNKGLASVKLRPGNSVQPQAFWEAVRKNGFTPKETRVVVRGEIIDGARPELKVTGTNQIFELKAEPKMLEDPKRQKAVLVEGSLTPAKDVKTPVPLEVRRISPNE
jgi:copper chaperone CopZ